MGNPAHHTHAHRKTRTTALRNLRDGDPCPRCHRPMYRANARHLDLDHAPDGTTYLGLSHAHCNRSAGATQGNRARGARRHTIHWRSRTW